MRFSLLIVLFSIAVSLTGQKPGSEIDFGKYSSKGGELFKKCPERYQATEHETTIDLQKAKVHYSRVFEGDTTSMSYNGYFVEFYKNRINSNTPDYEFYSDYVTNEDWNLFRKYVLDSTARKTLGHNMGPDGWLIPTYDEYIDERPIHYWNLDWNTSKLEFGLTSNNQQYFILAHLFYSESDRFNREVKIDDRDLFYQYYWIDFEAINIKSKTIKYKDVNGQDRTFKSYRNRSNFIIKEDCSIYRDSTMWITDSSSLHFGNIEDQLVTYYNWHEEFKDKPVIGITQPQARAYLNWLELNHNEYLMKNSIPYKVEYELPTKGPLLNLPSIEIPSFDLSAWQITNKQYKEFVHYVQDSIARRYLAEVWGEEGYLVPTYDAKHQERDMSDWNIDWKGKIDWDRKTSAIKHGKKAAPYGLIEELYNVQCCGDTNLIDKRKLNFEYYFYDLKTASIELERRPAKDGFDCKVWKADTCKWDKTCLNDPEAYKMFQGYEHFQGKDLNLSHINARCEATDVFSHEDRSQFIIKDILNVYPGVIVGYPHRRCVYNMNAYYDAPEEEICKYIDCEMCPQPASWEEFEMNPPKEYDFDSNPEALVSGLSYEQFRAYWWWWNRERRKKVTGNPVIADYIPSEEEFIKIQKGETVVHPKEVHALPTPTFNYVMKFYIRTNN